MSIRKFTIYLRDHGVDLIKVLFQKEQLSFEDFNEWFQVYGLSKEQKRENTKRIIDRLLIAGIVNYEEVNAIYQLSTNATNNIVEFVNMGKIRHGLIYYFERRLFSPEYLYHFTSASNHSPFYEMFLSLIVENLALLKFWEQLGNKHGLLISYIRAEEYYKKVTQSKVKFNKIVQTLEKSYDIPHEIREKSFIKKYNGYFELKNHFQKCFTRKCRVCGGNILNLIYFYIEKIKLEIRNSSVYDSFVSTFRKIAYRKEYINNELQEKVDELIPLNKEKFGKERRENVRSNIKRSLGSQAINLNALNYLRLKKIEESKAEHKSRQFIFSQAEKDIKKYTKALDNFFKILEPSQILDNLDLSIGEKFPLDEKVFKNYNENIKKLGREGEKRVYDALMKDYEDDLKITPKWENLDKESGKPYDILLLNTDGKDKYIEVKTTHSNKKSFKMSEKEIEFAIDNSDNYKLYLLVNFGSGPDSYKIIIENFKGMFGKTLKTTSRRIVHD
ncbi:hypothetical protein LCGC14_1236170 [marine sediment metagenome]|uniref:Protein NO VEIN C-terminal domain-containing protein n=1 Tax=marine sediment metagenome TaxID=412755 RepID=A0A0F9LU97_9ZZZZ